MPAKPIAVIQLMLSARVSEAPKSSTTGWINRPIEGSAVIPKITLLAVIPSCAPETWRRRSLCASNARRELFFPFFAASCRRRGRLAIKANSTATKIAFTTIRRITAMKIMTK